MGYWLALLLAIAGNIGANVAFKKFTNDTEFSGTWASIASSLLHPMLWLGLFLGVMLLGSYLVAIRQIPLSVAYTLATSLSIIGITCAGAFIFGEAVGLRAMLGIGLVIVGVAVITTG